MTRSNNSSKIPVQGGIRKRNNKMPMSSSSGDQSIVKYTTLGLNVATGGIIPGTLDQRLYIPGNGAGLTLGAGPSLVSFYSTARFLPGTTITWEPSVSFTTSGRVVCGFTDNPEICAAIDGLRAAFIAAVSTVTFNNYLNAIKSLGTVRAWPVWQSTSVSFPTKLRRKRFDVNTSAAATSDVLDRSMQVGFFTVIEGVPLNTTLGSFMYHDVVDVEGVTGIAT